MSQALPSDPILVFDIETVADVDAARRTIRNWPISTMRMR